MSDKMDMMALNPKSIAVVIPAYNASRYLAETLESALAQTLPPDEVVVIDDGSTDDTAAIAARYTPSVRVISRANQGVAASRNCGIEATSSNWIAFLDADDLWLPNMLERQMEEVTKIGADIGYTGYVLLMQHGDATTLGAVCDAPAAKDIREALFRKGLLPSSVIVRRSMLAAVNGFDPTMPRGNEDYDLWLRMLHAGAKFAACREPLLQYRRHEGNWFIDREALEVCLANYRRLVLPYLPKATGWITYNRYRSGIECDCAFTMREKGQTSSLSMMARSIWHRPFGDNVRYKVLAHMLYMRLKAFFRRSSTSEVI